MKKKMFPDERLKGLYENGKSSRELSEIFNCDGATIKKNLVRLGVKTRTPSEAQKNRFEVNPESHGWKGKKHSIEQKLKWSISRRGKQVGKDNPSYKNGGRGMGVSTYTRFRAMQCQECGSMNNLCVHHIDKNRANNDSSNLITLCGSCHTKLHHPIKCQICYENRKNGGGHKKCPH